METVTNSVELAHAPNVEAVAKTLSRGSETVKQRLLNHAKTCVQPAHIYYKRQLSSSLKVPLLAFKAARLFSSKMVNVLKPLAMIDTLVVFPFLKEKISSLKQELPLYLTKSSEIPDSTDCLQWWKTNTTELPVWSSAAQLVLLVQPSSAAAERVFSLLNSSFTDR